MGSGEFGVVISEILLDFRIRRWSVSRLVRGSSEVRAVKRLSSSVRSVMVGARKCVVRVV